MRKLANHIAWSVLLKYAAVDPEMRARLKTVAKQMKVPVPTEAELEKMFPRGWEKLNPDHPGVWQESPGFRDWQSKVKTPKGVGPTGPYTSSDPEGDAADAASWAAHSAPMSQKAKLTMDLARGATLLGGLAQTGTGIGIAASGVNSARKTETPAERYAILGLGGGLTGGSLGEAYKSFQTSQKFKRIGDLFGRNEYRQGEAALKEMLEQSMKAKIQPKHIGGLAGLGLGLGGAALWNHLANREPAKKVAMITPEEVSMGLAGQAARPGITEQEIKELSNKYRAEESHKQRFKPLMGAIPTSVLGGLVGYLKNPKLPSIASGAATGLVLGGVGGALLQELNAEGARQRGRHLGLAARSGRLSLNLGEDPREYVQYATGTRPDAHPKSMEENAQDHNKLLRKRMLYGALSSLPFTIGLSAMAAMARKNQPHMPPVPIRDFAEMGITGLAGGAYLGAQAAVDQSHDITDLRNRGYDALAKKIEKI